MPIRINLLAEAQELEDQRRRDPVKRVLLAGAALLVLMLIWSSSLMVQAILAKGRVGQLEAELNARTDEYKQILENQKRLGETRQKLAALQNLAANRFLLGNLLDALQHTVVENVQFVQLRLDQAYALTPETKPKTEEGHTVPGKPATVTEKTVLALNARDTSPLSGDAMNKFKDALTSAPYFREGLGQINGFTLTALGAPQSEPNGQTFVTFAIEGRFPEKTR